ncbi:MAG: hypothetical protein P1T08_07895 [Acidimicrobiia bacterium]|nr:hypothetical protein [Acidimicrobiia bacterium]
MKTITTERCEFCNGQAVAYQRGALVCGRCGVRRTFGNGPITIPPPRRRRTAVIGIFSSGLVIKLMMGSVALAAVGGFASASVVPAPNPFAGETESTVAGVQIDAPGDQIDAPSTDLTFDEMIALVSSAQSQAVSARELAAAAQEWADCVSDYAKGYHEEGLNPTDVCGPHPRPSQFGLDDDDESGAEQSDDHEEFDSADDLESLDDSDALDPADEKHTDKPEKIDKPVPDQARADGEKSDKTDKTGGADSQGDDNDD